MSADVTVPLFSSMEYLIRGNEISLAKRSNIAISSEQARLGLGIVSRHTVELELETGRLVELDVQHFPLRRHWYLVRRQEKQLSPVARRFESYLLEPGNH